MEQMRPRGRTKKVEELKDMPIGNYLENCCFSEVGGGNIFWPC